MAGAQLRGLGGRGPVTTTDTPPRRHALCGWCDREMNGVSCAGPTVEILRPSPDATGAKPGTYQRVPYDPDYGDETQRCRDCGTPRHGLHHPGCDMEQCPTPECVDIEGRRNQAISCGCRWAGDPGGRGRRLTATSTASALDHSVQGRFRLPSRADQIPIKYRVATFPQVRTHRARLE